MRHRLLVHLGIAALRGWEKRHGGRGEKRRHFDVDSKPFSLFFCASHFSPFLLFAFLSWCNYDGHVRGMSYPSFCWCAGQKWCDPQTTGVFVVCVGERERVRWRKRGGGVFQSRVINHRLGSKRNTKDSEPIISAFTTLCLSPHTHTNTHTNTCVRQNLDQPG